MAPQEQAGAAPAVARPEAQRRARVLAALAADWQEDLDYDSTFLTVGSLMYCAHATRLALREAQPLLTAAQHAQNAAFLAGMVLLLVLLRRAPDAYRRWSPVLKFALLLFGYARPVFGAANAIDPVVEGPSMVPIFGPLIDGLVLWMCCRGTFLSFAAVGFRPPLYLALPLQLFGVWHASEAGHCATPLLRHPVVQQRIASVHALFSNTFEAVVGGTYAAAVVADEGPEGRCTAALLFFHAVFSVLVPLLLLLPWQQPTQPPGGRQALGASARLEAWLQGWLGLLLWPWPVPAARGGGHTAAGQRDQGRGTGADMLAFALRWALVLLTLWTACTLLTIRPASA